VSTPERVVVTGLGLATSVGTGVERAFAALVAGQSGIGPITAFDAHALRSRIAGEVRDLDPARLPAKSARRSARFTHLALAAAGEALEQAALPSPAQAECAVLIGTGIGGFDFGCREHEVFLARGPERFHPLTVPIIIPNMAAAGVALEHSLGGPCLCPVTACASGANAIGTAFDMIRSGRVATAVAGATESTLCAFAVDGYCQLRALSTRNDAPAAASRPFSASRDGFVIAEGAGTMVLESLTHAATRGAEVLAELVGYGTSADAHHITAPDPAGRGAVRAMRMALADARMAPEAIEVVNAHGTSTPLNDATETRALHEVFGGHARRLWVHATKSMTGHALGGAAAIEAVVAVMTLVRGVVHPTVNLDDPDPACDLDHVPHTARERAVRTVMSNAFGFGGHNAVLVFRQWDGRTA
jgi:3-oxoacyl-[acyl-carrier-protein] synthase II